MKTIIIALLFLALPAFAHPLSPKGGDELKAQLGQLQQCVGQVQATQADPTAELENALKCRVYTADSSNKPVQTDVVTLIGQTVVSLGKRIEEVNTSLGETDKWVNNVQGWATTKFDALDSRFSNLPTTTRVVHEYVNTPSTATSTPTPPVHVETETERQARVRRELKDAAGPDSGR